MRIPLRLLASSVGLLLLACSGGGGDGGSPTVPPMPPPPAPIGFTPSGTGGAESLALTEGPGTGRDSLFLSLEGTAVVDLYGIAFDLTFPSNLLNFVGVTEGAFLSGGGSVDTSLQVAQNPPGTLVVGLSRLGQVAGRSGTGSLLSIEFSRAQAGQGSFGFVNNQGFDSTGAAIATLQWSGGTVNVPQ